MFFFFFFFNSFQNVIPEQLFYKKAASRFSKTELCHMKSKKKKKKQQQQATQINLEKKSRRKNWKKRVKTSNRIRSTSIE